jgi:hypothetical protein
MKLGLSWGSAVVAMVWSGAALAQVPGPSGATMGGSPGGMTGSPGVAPPMPPEGAPAPAPVPETPPAAETPPPAPPAAQVQPDRDEDEAVDEAPRRKKRKKKRRHEDDEEYESEGEARGEEPEERPAPSEWRLAGPHFIVSAERLTGILAWSQTVTREVDTFQSGGTTQTQEATVSGTDVSLLGVGNFGDGNSFGGLGDNLFSTPRIAFDYVFKGGFSLGGSLGYMVRSGETEVPATNGSSGTTTQERPTKDILVFSPRLGVFLEGTPKVGVWLRGGITRLVASSERDEVVQNGSLAGTIKTETTLSLWDVTLDPQLVLSPVPHVGITIGASLDIGVSGSIKETTGSASAENDVTASSYGVTAGLIAMF